ncbi:hypothetical protein OF83DRAFT_1128468 [Amylostereum chailletii]|nr:hypothetical protein OF83DRAFT_1128468 [Amylostereum chailletii]
MEDDTIKCVGCNRSEFTNSRGLRTHQTRCKKYLNMMGETSEMHKRPRDSELEPPGAIAKRARFEGRVGGDEAVDIPDVCEEVIDTIVEPPYLSPSPPISPAPEFVSAHSGRSVRFPARFADFLPSSKTPLGHIPKQIQRPPESSLHEDQMPSPDIHSPEREPTPPAPTSVQTEPNAFGLFRVYPQPPTLDPAESECLSDLCDSPTLRIDAPPTTDKQSPAAPPSTAPDPRDGSPFYAPFSSATAATVMVCGGTESGQKSGAQMQRLSRMLGKCEDDPEALQTNLAHMSISAERARMDAHLANPDTPLEERDGWKRSSVKIRLPCDGVKQAEEDAPELLIDNIYHRDIVDTIVNTFESDTARTFHMTPFEHFWQPGPDEPTQRVYSEVYSADAMLEAYAEVQALPRAPGDDLERVVAGMLYASDSTHLASFGGAALWPIYEWYGNQSKYIRCKPTCRACTDIAHIPSLPDMIQEAFIQHFGKPATAAILAHCKREMVHAIWELLLDDKFMDAYRNGIVVRCGDGIVRRIYPRLLIYSADYPEKVLLVTMKGLANRLCPRCLIEKHQLFRMGMKSDLRIRHVRTRVDDRTRQTAVHLARHAIFNAGLSINSAGVQDWMRPNSLVPTENAFSKKLAPLGFDFHKIFSVDLLHEFELGVWKSIMTHLIRLLDAAGEDKLQEFNRRFRMVPTFQRDIIRRFDRNVSALKKLAARDFEDLLQCIIPVFEGLMDAPHDKIISDMLFDLATWHAYAKLRLHTDTTLEFFREVTTSVGESVRRFQKETCLVFDTRELPHETAARGRRQAALQKVQPTSTSPAPVKLSRAHKAFNLSTYKWHSLADYPDSIPFMGTTDNGSTQTGELQHRRSKRLYSRTNRHNIVAQIAKQDARETLLHIVGRRLNAHIKKKDFLRAREKCRLRAQRRHALTERLPQTEPNTHYDISQTATDRVNIAAWLSGNEDDPALKNYLDKLRDHVLARLLGQEYDGDQHQFTNEERESVIFVRDELHQHQVLRVNFTTDDLRRKQDTINPRTHADVMVLSPDKDGSKVPYWFARVLDIFHLDVIHRGPLSQSTKIQRVDVLWVRWLGLNVDNATTGGWMKRRLHGVGFVPQDDADAFGFLNPDQVIRAAYLVPAFAYGRTSAYLKPSIARLPHEHDEDWNMFYAMSIVDRDTFMRFRGGGVGHLGTRHLNAALCKERHRRPEPARKSTGSALDAPFDSEEDEPRADTAPTSPTAGGDNHDGDEADNDENDDEDEDEDDDEVEWVDTDGEGEDGVEVEEDLEEGPNGGETDERVLDEEGFAPL